MRSLSLICLGKFVIYIPFAGVILPLHLNYICVCIDMFVNCIPVSALICLCILYNTIVGCPLYWIFISIYLLCMGYYSTTLLLHSHLYLYVCECYIYFYWDMLVFFVQCNTWLYNILGILSCICFVYTLLSYFFRPRWLAFTKVYWHLFVWISCHMHWNTYFCS